MSTPSATNPAPRVAKVERSTRESSISVELNLDGTGVTNISTGIAFFISIFFAPIFASIPSWATGGALVIVGSLMIRK